MIKSMPRKDSTEEYVAKFRKKYKALRPIYSKALKGTIFFTSEGFNHLLFKNGHRRPIKVIRSRLPLINLIPPVLIHSETVGKIRIQEERYKGRKVSATYFEFKKIVGAKRPTKIKVVIKKRGSLGKLQFLSVMKQKTPKKGR